MDDESNKIEEGKKDEDGGNTEKVNVLVDVSKDGFEAHITLIRASESPKVDIEDIKSALFDKGVRFGIKEEMLVILEAEPKFNERILIASGIKPTDEKDGYIKYNVDTGSAVKVETDEIIAEIIPPEEGAEGETVLGDKIPPKAGTLVQVPSLVNAIISPEKKNFIVSTTTGYLTIEQASIKVEPFFSLKVSPDRMKAFIKVTKLLNEGDFSADDIKQLLSDKKIVYGINDTGIKSIFERNRFNEEILIARGKQVVHGKNGEIKLNFDTELKPEMDEQGNVDYKNLNLIQNFSKDDRLAEAIPPVEGKEGCDIFGETIVPMKGKQAILPLGTNVNLDPENTDYLLASTDGCVKVKGKNINIDPVFVVKSNVDYETGKISFLGSVIIKGDVLTGFNVKAKGDIQIDGLVEDSNIESEGDILIKAGFMGKGKGRIVSGGRVMAKFCDNQSIKAGNDILITDFVMHCNIETKGQLIVSNQNGIIIGGDIFAVKGVEAKVIGNNEGVYTKIFAGIDKETREKIDEKKVQLSKNIKNKEEIEKALEILHKEKSRRKKLPKEKEQLLEKINMAKEKVDEDKIKLVQEIEELEAKMEEFKSAKVRVIDVVHPGTNITIYNKSINITEPLKYVYFKYSESGLVAEDLSALE